MTQADKHTSSLLFKFPLAYSTPRESYARVLFAHPPRQTLVICRLHHHVKVFQVPHLFEDALKYLKILFA